MKESASEMAISSSSGGRKSAGTPSPCAACKMLRRRCTPECVFAPYFPAGEPHKFANVHKIFGASNVNKMLQDLPVHQRSDAVSSLVYEANARVRDPVYGCVAAVSSLQLQIDLLQTQLALARAEVLQLKITMHHHIAAAAAAAAAVSDLLPVESSHSESMVTTKLTPNPTRSLFILEDQFPNIGETLWSC